MNALSELDTIEWLVLSAAWLIGAFGSGALLAKLYKRLHPELSFYKLWALWTVVVSVVAALILILS